MVNFAEDKTAHSANVNKREVLAEKMPLVRMCEQMLAAGGRGTRLLNKNKTGKSVIKPKSKSQPPKSD